MFLQEIINDLERNGFVNQGKADTMLKDWASELKSKCPKRDRLRLKRTHAKLVGRELY